MPFFIRYLGMTHESGRFLIRIRKGLLSLVLPSLVSAQTAERVRYQPTTPQVVIVAHQDDWQLFMGDALATHIASGSRIVFVYLTSGDVGRDSSYWRTREAAAIASEAQLVRSSAQSVSPSCDTASVGAHRITRCILQNSTAWFLRLPDGGRNGTGYRTHSYQSLRKLRSRRISVIDAIDNSARYRGWQDLVSTVRAIVSLESGSVALHANDPSVLINPHDHFDHRMAGRLAQDLERSERWPAFYYLGYALATRDDNLRPAGVQLKTRLFQAYDSVMIAANRRWSALAEHRTFYSECLRRTYWRRSPRASDRSAAAMQTHSPTADMR